MSECVLLTNFLSYVGVPDGLKNKKDLKQAIAWMEKGIAEGNPNAFWNIHRLAQMKKDAGDKAGAKEAAQKSLEMAKKADSDFGYIKLNEALIATLK